MRAARLLQILLLLQNRGRQTSGSLAMELEVTPRTILRDVDAMTEAGLPILVHRGSAGGIELGFNYRTRLTGLAADEAEALAIWLSVPPVEIAELGLAVPASRGRAKFVESLPDRSRAIFAIAAARFPRTLPKTTAPDPRIAAIAKAVRDQYVLRLRARSPNPLALQPTTLACGPNGWTVVGPPLSEPVPMSQWGDINLSRRQP